MKPAPLPSPPLTPRARTIVLGLALLYAAVVVPAAIHRSTDLQSHLMLANRMLDGLRVYEPKPQFGTWWPPGALALLTPLALLARLSLATAKGVFAAAGVACVVWLVVRAPVTRWVVVALALAAVSGPLQKDFENLNLNVVVLTLILAATRDMSTGRDDRAGVWLGLATAAKVFPALLVLYAAWRGRWRTALWATGLAVLVSLLPLAVRGVGFIRETITDWVLLTTSGTAALRGQTHSLSDVIARFGAPPVVGLLVNALLLAGAVWWLRHRRPLLVEVAFVTHIALLTTPLVWAQNFLLLYPTWLVILDSPPRLPRAAWRGLLAPVGIVTSGIVTAVSRPVRIALYRVALYTWGALATLVVLLWVAPLGERNGPSVD